MITVIVSAILNLFRSLDLKVSENDSTVSIERILRDMDRVLDQIRRKSANARDVFAFGKELIRGELVNSFDDEFEKRDEEIRRDKISRQTQDLWSLFAILSLLISKLNDVAIYARMSEKGFKSLIAKAFRLTPVEQSKLTSEANITGLLNVDGMFIGLSVIDMTCYLTLKFEGIIQILGNNAVDYDYLDACQETSFDKLQGNEEALLELLGKCNYVFAKLGAQVLDFENSRNVVRSRPDSGLGRGSRAIGDS